MIISRDTRELSSLYDTMDIDEAVDFVVKADKTADRYAVSKVKQLFSKYFPNTPVYINALYNSYYKSPDKEHVKKRLLEIRNTIKKQHITTLKEIDQLLYDYVRVSK